MGAGLDDTQIKAALDACASEPVHIPGIIQPHGGLIGVDMAKDAVLYASETIDAHIGQVPAEIFGKSLATIFGEEIADRMQNSVSTLQDRQSVVDLGVVEVAGHKRLLSACAAPNCTIFEFEPFTEDGGPDADMIAQLELLLSETRAARSFNVLFEKTTALLQALTGYDRVMVYEFDEESNGQVKGEAVVPEMEPYLGMKFPAWDIPEQARQIMAKTPLRYIADVRADTVPLLAATKDLPDLDMTYAHLRGVSAVHLTYMQNIGAASSFTLNIKVADQLWGIISFHHRSQTYPTQKMRRLCRNFAEIFAMQIDLLAHDERQSRLLRVDHLKRRITRNSTQKKVNDEFEAALLEDLRQAVDADGAALLYTGELHTAGTVPSDQALLALLKAQTTQTGLIATANVAASHPAIAHALAGQFAGVLLSYVREDCTLAFFRHDRAQTVTWAGAPEKDIVIEDGKGRLEPRGSFSMYKQKVTGTSIPWTSDQKRLAEDFWSIFVSAEREKLIRKTNRQQTLIIDELNHRVRNILALIRSLSHQTLENHTTIAGFVDALDARIAAVASAHDLGVEKGDDSATVMQILELEGAPHNENGQRVLIAGDDTSIRAELAPMFALVIHELMTNAAKYGALSVPTGEVRILIVRGAEGLVLSWQETGGPAVSAPTRKGFGSSLIETSVPYELGGTIKLVYDPAGVRATLTLPERAIAQRALPDLPQNGDIMPALARQYDNTSEGLCLLVEDSYVVSLDTTRVLKKVGIAEVEVALNVDEALKVLDRVTPTLAVLDVNLSAGETSQPIAEALRKMGVPIVFITGYGDTDGLDTSFRNYPVLKKPVRDKDLKPILAKLNL